MEEVLRLKELYKLGKLTEAEWFQKRDKIINQKGFYSYAPNKESLDRFLEMDPETNDYFSLCESLWKISYRIFLWNPDTLEERCADKLYFVKKKGLEKLIEVVKNENQGQEAREYAASCLWNFSELDFHRRKAAKHGVIEAAVYALNSAPFLVRKSLGILWSFLEYDDFQVRVMDLGVVPLLINLLSDPQYDKLNIIGCLFSISCNRQCRPRMKEIINAILQLPTEEIDSEYFCSLCLSNMLMDQSIEIDDIQKQSAKERISRFLNEFTPADMRRIEDKHHYTWVTFKPFLDLTCSNVIEVHNLGLFALANITYSVANRDIILKNGIKDDIIAAAIGKTDKYSITILENYKATFTVPKLKSIILSRYPQFR